MSIDRTKLIEVVRPILDESTFFKLQNEIANKDFVPPKDLEKYGIISKYDSNLLKLELNIPIQEQRVQVLRMPGSSIPNYVAATPADFSVYLNMRTTMNLQTAYDIQNSITLPTQLILQPVINYKGWVLDTSVTSSVIEYPSISLDYARVVHDFPDNSQRLTIGSVFFPTTAFMAPFPAYGVEFTRNPIMTQALRSPYLIRQSFELSQPSAVSIILNDRTLESYQLNSGKYVLPDIPFIGGLNDLVINTNGQITHTEVSYDARLLVENDMSYSVNVAIPQWELQVPIFSGYFLYGILPFLTVGVNMQAGLGRQMEGVEAVYSTPYGSVHGQFGLSESPIDFAAEIDYRLVFAYGNLRPTVTFSAQYTGQNFLLPGFDYNSNIYAWLFSASYGQSLPYGIGLSLGVGYQVGLSPNPDQASANITLTKQIFKDTNISLMFTVAYQAGNPLKFEGYFGLASVALGGKETTNFNSQLDGQSASVNATYQPNQSLPMFSTFLAKSPDLNGAISANYNVPFTESSLTESFSPTTNSLVLSAGVAIVMVEGHFGITRPISDSFALIIPQDNMAGQTVVANKQAETYDGMAMKNFNIGLSQLPSYTLDLVTLSSPTAPIDTNVGDSIRVMKPTYKSGIALFVGTKAAISIKGKLTFNGQPFTYQSGQIKGNTSVTFFTDENGDFEAYGLSPGDYQLTINDLEGYSQKITIPIAAPASYNIGTIVVQEKKQ